MDYPLFCSLFLLPLFFSSISLSLSLSLLKKSPFINHLLIMRKNFPFPTDYIFLSLPSGSYSGRERERKKEKKKREKDSLNYSFHFLWTILSQQINHKIRMQKINTLNSTLLSFSFSLFFLSLTSFFLFLHFSLSLVSLFLTFSLSHHPIKNKATGKFSKF